MPAAIQEVGHFRDPNFVNSAGIGRIVEGKKLHRDRAVVNVSSRQVLAPSCGDDSCDQSARHGELAALGRVSEKGLAGGVSNLENVGSIIQSGSSCRRPDPRAPVQVDCILGRKEIQIHFAAVRKRRENRTRRGARLPGTVTTTRTRIATPNLLS